MKNFRTLLLVVFLCIVSQFNYAQTTWTNLTYNPDQKNIEYNPLKGWMSGYDLNQINFPSSTKHFYISLKEVYLNYGSYNWAALDAKLNLNPGIMSIPRFYIDYPGSDYQMPEFLNSKVPSFPYTAFDNTKSRMPDYNDEDLIYALEQFAAAYGARYNNDPRIACIDIGIYGFWGEWHVWPYNGYNDPLDYQMNQTNKDRLIRAHVNAFPNTQVQVRMPSSTYDESIKHRLGRYDDSFAYTTYGFWDDMVANGLQDNYKTHPMGGEVHPNVKTDELLNSWPYYHPETNQNLEECIRRTHASWMGAHGIFTTTLNSTQYNNAIRASKLMGYTYYVRNVKLTPGTDKKVNVEVNIQNKGIAPFYYNWDVEFGAKNTSTGAFTTLGTTKWNLPDIQATGADYYKSANTNALPDGNYKILMQIKNPLKAITSLAKPLRFANTTQDNDVDGWLTLGTVTIGTVTAGLKAEAEAYKAMSGIGTENCSEGTLNVGWIDPGDWMEYDFNVPSAGNYTMDYRVASPSATAQIACLNSSGATLSTTNVPNTGGYQTWLTVTSSSMSLPSGIIRLKIKANTGGFNLNWLELKTGTTQFTLTSSAGNYGSISPNGTISVSSGANQTYAITANSGYQVDVVTVDGVSKGAITSYTFSNVTTNHTISATFKSVSTTFNPFNQTEAENYSSMLGIQTANCVEGGMEVGWIESGDYIVFNNGNFSTGASSFSARVSSGSSGGSIEVRLDSPTGTLVGTCTVPGTGSYTTYTTVSCPISGATGTHNLYLKFTGAAGYLLNINWFKFIPGTTQYTLTSSAGNYGSISPNGTISVSSGANQTYAITANSGYQVDVVTVDGVSQGAITTYTFSNVTVNHTISATFKSVSTTFNPFNQTEAENYNSMLGIQTAICPEGGMEVGWIENGDYIVFNGGNFSTGASSFSARVSSGTSGGSIEVRLDSPTGTLVGTCTVPGTGSFTTYTTVSCPISGATGTHNLYLKFTGATGYLLNINWFKFTPISGGINPYNTVEAESYSSMLGVQAEACSEGGQNIGWIENGDYIIFNNVDFGTGATGFEARVSSGSAGGTIEVRLGGPTGTLVGTCAVTNTGDWTIWATKTCAISGASGTQTLCIKFVGGTSYLMNLNWIKFTQGTTCNNWTTSNFSVANTIKNFTSGEINISCASSVTLSMDITENVGLENDDVVKVSYILDNNAEVIVWNQMNDFTSKAINVSGLSGSKITVKIYCSTNNAVQVINFANIKVTINSLKAAEVPLLADENVSLGNYANVYPNPVSETLYVNHADAKGVTMIRIFNTQGQVLYMKQAVGSTTLVDVEALNAKGLIFVQVTSGQDISTFKVLVVQ